MFILSRSESALKRKMNQVATAHRELVNNYPDSLDATRSFPEVKWSLPSAAGKVS